MTVQGLSVASYEAQVQAFKPKHGLTATNTNDLRLFLYEWFTHFEHAAPADFYLSHLDGARMHVAFPGVAAFTSHADFAGWYNNLLAQTLWNFHDLSSIEIKRMTEQAYLISFVVDWYGEVKSDSDQLGGWQSRSDSCLYHHKLRQTWTVRADGRLIMIERLIVSGGDTPSPGARERAVLPPT